MKMVLMSVRLRWLGIVTSLFALLGLAGCANAGPASTSPTGTRGQRTIVTAFYPLQFVAERVASDRATVTSLDPAGGRTT